MKGLCKRMLHIFLDTASFSHQRKSREYHHVKANQKKMPLAKKSLKKGSQAFIICAKLLF